MYNSLYDALERIYPTWDFRILDEIKNSETNVGHLLSDLENAHKIPIDFYSNLSGNMISDILVSGKRNEIVKGTKVMFDYLSKEVPNGFNWILSPARIISATLEYKKQITNSKIAEELLLDSINFALEVYQNPDSVVEQIGQFRENVLYKDSGLLSYPCKFSTDGISFSAYQPSYSNKTLESLLLQTNGQPITFVALANGGIPAGMDIFLRYRDKVESPESSIFYSTRCSMNKNSDTRPQLNSWEIRYLWETTGEKPIVLFDEDVSSGLTLAKSREFFRKYFPDNKIIVKTNKGFVSRVDECSMDYGMAT